MARKAVSPEGYEWKVRRRWLTRRPRGRVIAVRHRMPMFAGLFLLAIQVLHLVVYLARLAWRFAVDVPGHVFRGRPWLIEARLEAAHREHRLLWHVEGWRDSRAAVQETVRALKRGETMTRFGEGESHG